MKKCINCHQKAEKICIKGFCEDCHDAMHPNEVFEVAYDYNKGTDNISRKVK